MREVVVVLVMLPLCFVSWVLLRAMSARMMTGAWPHQSEESKNIFDSLP